jgi:putative metalloenzyme radical SAM/SPASM domain maturase
MKQNADGGGCDGDMDPAIFERLEEAFPGIDALVLNGVGEPLLNPHLERFIQRARRLMPAHAWIGFQTNGILLTTIRALALINAGLDRICISMDGIAPDAFRDRTTGGHPFDPRWAFSAAASARSICHRPELEIGMEYVVMRDNLRELPAAIERAASWGATFAIVSHLHPFDDVHAAQSVYGSCSGEAISLYQVWRDKAAVAGVDIHRYFDLLWRFRRSPEEQRIIAIVEAMKADAQDHGITLDLRKLFALDTAWLVELEELFDEAGDAARRAGVALKLPEIVPRARRRCAFVEEGGAFVSWDGGVHPCYHLWHACRSFAAGWQHQVQPKLFGTVAERGILEVWNSPAFRTYRENVLRSEYPSCAGCALAPCDSMESVPFEQDCYANTEPCGGCLWSAGIFHCLS